MHLRRWLTAIIGVPVLIYIIGPGPRWLFHALLFITSIIGLHEFFAIAAHEVPLPIKLASFILSFLLFFLISHGPFFMVLAAICLWATVPLAFYLLICRAQKSRALEDTGKIVFGLLYICFPLSLLIFIDKHPRGNLWILFLIAVIFVSDTGAFYLGRFFGAHKLYPSVSPGKTWEGSIGGVLSTLIPVALFPYFFPLYTFNLSIVTLAVSLSIFGQIGDLAESMIKRSYGVKDSGKILPGHGGMLDRIDGLLFSIPILYIFLTWSIP
jgi:phosphatidate cytidylyltransferase